MFHKSLELHLTLSEKYFCVTNFSFLTDSLKPPHPRNVGNSQNPLSMTKVFVNGQYQAGWNTNQN